MKTPPLLTSPALTTLGIPHAFTTRHTPLDAALQQLRLNPDHCVTAHQVHGCAVSHPDARLAEADAIVVTTLGHAAAIRIADCVPVLLAAHTPTPPRGDAASAASSPAQTLAVAAAHAGWRGLVANVLREAVDTLRADHPDAAITAAIGPCISVQHFEVSPEVADHFDPTHVQYDLPSDPSKPHVDLRAAAHQQLQAAHVTAIDHVPGCTYAEPDRFFSHRRDVTHHQHDTTGRQHALIAMPPSNTPAASLTQRST
ncbi:MAG: polyphenol oxidase family protein [Planctomycetota bacterium]